MASQTARACFPAPRASDPRLSRESRKLLCRLVEDTVRGFIAAARSDSAVGRVVNLGSGTGISIGDLAEKILQLCGSEAVTACDEDRVRPDKSEVMELICGNALAGELLGWHPEMSLDEGLKRVITFIRDHPHLYRPNEYNI